MLFLNFLSEKAILTNFWQSSNVPLTSIDFTFFWTLVNCSSWISVTLLEGYKITTFIPSTPEKPFATAPPVSPEVATKIVNLFWFKMEKDLAKNLAAKSLKARVGPWNNSKI